jgi:chromosome partitioning protein
MQRPAHRSRVLAVVNQKGGVGKTTTAVNLAASFAASERSTLLVDLDPQANASSAYLAQRASRHIYDAIIGRCVMKDVVHATELRYLHVVPSGRDLYGAEIELVSAIARERRLAAALADLRDAYDLVLIDCPPSLGLLVDALTAAMPVIIPLRASTTLEGLAGLLETIDIVPAIIPARAPGIALRWPTDQQPSRQVELEVRSHFGSQVFETVIPRNVRLSEAPSHGKPVLLYDAHSKGATSHLRLAEEILGRHPAQRAQLASSVPAIPPLAPDERSKGDPDE